jgi:hypothetical protein
MLTKLVTGSLLLAFAVAIPIQHGNAQGEPKGWRCEYRIDDGTRSSPRLYNCFGTNLNDTRARAKARCAGNPYCNAGACLPLDRVPGNSCQR